MHRNFYGFDPSYHVARHHFVHKLPHAWTPRHLARGGLDGCGKGRCPALPMGGPGKDKGFQGAIVQARRQCRRGPCP